MEQQEEVVEGRELPVTAYIYKYLCGVQILIQSTSVKCANNNNNNRGKEKPQSRSRNKKKQFAKSKIALPEFPSSPFPPLPVSTFTQLQ